MNDARTILKAKLDKIKQDECLKSEMLLALERVAVMLSAHKNADYQFMLSLIEPTIKKARGEI